MRYFFFVSFMIIPVFTENRRIPQVSSKIYATTVLLVMRWFTTINSIYRLDSRRATSLLFDMYLWWKRGWDAGHNIWKSTYLRQQDNINAKKMYTCTNNTFYLSFSLLFVSHISYNPLYLRPTENQIKYSLISMYFLSISRW